jgi:hypothetical protein
MAGEEGYLYFLFEHKSYPYRPIILQIVNGKVGRA